MSNQLLPCPFCGAEPAPYTWKAVGCMTPNCAMEGLHIYHEAWNRRATQPAAGEPEQQAAINADDLPTKKYPLGAFDLDAPVAAGEPEMCPTCGEDEPFTGSCGTSKNDTRALCRRPTPPAAAHGDDRVAGLRWVIARCAVMQEKGFERVLLKAFKRDLEVALDAMRAQAGEGGEV